MIKGWKESEFTKRSLKRKVVENNEDGSGTTNDNPIVPAAASDDEDDLRAEIRQNNIDEEDLMSMKIPPMPEPIMASDGSSRRLMISTIEVESFKSYYGQHVLGPYHHRFSAVIGPNGSGKSNVIDSLLFVFGYRASKIRSKKLSVLIHSSTEHVNIPSCSVNINFQRIIDSLDGSYQVVEGSQFTVGRTAYRDNSSKYTYNGKAKQFKEIARILCEVGVDLIHNRFLILQGDVEQIALMKPKALNETDEGMLEYLEDIIGSSRLKVPIDKLQRKIETLQDERSSVLMRLKHAETEKVAGEGPVRELINEMRIENGLTLLHNRLYQYNKLELSCEFAGDLAKKEAITTELEQIRKRQDEIISSQSARNEERNELRKNLEKAQKELDSVDRETENFKRAICKDEADLCRLEDKKKNVEKLVKKEQTKISDYETMPQKSTVKIGEYQAILKEAHAVIAEKRAEVDEKLAELEKNTVGLKTKKIALEEEVGKLAVVEDSAMSKYTLVQEELHLLVCEEEKERHRLMDLQRAYDDARKSLESKESELPRTKKALFNVIEEFSKTKTSLESKRVEETTLIEELRSCRQKLEQCAQNAESSRNQSNSLKYLMSAKASGKLPGLFGRLGDLGAIDKKYDVAISTVCGALDFIVVDTTETGRRCVELLREGNLHTISIIPLDKQKKLSSYMAKPKFLPENSSRLFDLIQVKDARVLPAFYYALKETLVADNTATATRIGLGGEKRYRVVTLKGEVIEASGAMSGGGKSERRGRIGNQVAIDTSKDSALEVADLRRKLEEKEGYWRNMKDDIFQLDTRMTTLQSDIDKLEQNERNLTNDATSLRGKITNTEKLLNNQKAQMEKIRTSDKSAIALVRSKADQLKLERDKATEGADRVREKVASITQRIQDVYDRLVAPHQKDLDVAEAKKEEATSGITKEQTALNTMQRNVNKAKLRLNDLITDSDETIKSIRDLRERVACNRISMEELEDSKEKKKIKVNEVRRKLEDSMGQANELDAEEMHLREQVASLSRSLIEQEKILQKFLCRIENIQLKINSLQLKFIKCLKRLLENMQDLEDEFGDLSLEEALALERKYLSNDELKESSTEVSDSLIELVTSLPAFTREEIMQFDLENIRFNIANLEKRNRSNVTDICRLKDYVKKLSRYDREMEALSAVSLKRDRHRELYETLRKQRLSEFMNGFIAVGVALKEAYQMITLGGDASLDLVDSLDPFSEGISFGVRPPKKSWKQICNLSGGEKTLSSLALVFALHHYRPTPFYIMDEIDAALDYRNVSIIAHYLKDRTKNAQFIVVSLRNNMFELADRLVGIFKTFDCTRSVTIDPALVYVKMRRYKALEVARKARLYETSKEKDEDADLLLSKANDNCINSDGFASQSQCNALKTAKKGHSSAKNNAKAKDADSQMFDTDIRCINSEERASERLRVVDSSLASSDHVSLSADCSRNGAHENSSGSQTLELNT